MLTIFPILIAAGSLAFAIMEKYERAVVQDTLRETEGQLAFANIRNDVAAEAITGLIRIASPGRTTTGPNENDLELIEKIKNSIREEMSREQTDFGKLEVLERKPLNAKSGEDLFGKQ